MPFSDVIYDDTSFKLLEKPTPNFNIFEDSSEDLNAWLDSLFTSTTTTEQSETLLQPKDTCHNNEDLKFTASNNTSFIHKRRWSCSDLPKYIMSLPEPEDTPEPTDLSLVRARSNSIVSTDEKLAVVKSKNITLDHTSIITMTKTMTNNNNKQYSCPICLEVMTRPTTLADCGHTFCYNCLRAAAAADIRECPLCRDLKSSLDPASHYAHTVLGGYIEAASPSSSSKEEKCLFDSALNEEDRSRAMAFRRKYQYWRRKFHYGARGEFRSVIKKSCFRPGGQVIVANPKKKEMMTAVALPLKPKKTACPCGNYVGDNIAEHMENDCPLTLVRCPFSHKDSGGCPVTLPRYQMAIHVHDPVAMQTHLAQLTEIYQQKRKESSAQVAAAADPVKRRRRRRSSSADFVCIKKQKCSTSNTLVATWKTEITSSTAPPSPRYNHGVANAGHKMFVLGGATKTSHANDFFLYDLRTRVWMDLSHIKARPSSSASNNAALGESISVPKRGTLFQLCVVRNNLIVLGGTKEGTHLSEAYVIRNVHQNPDSYHWESPTRISGDIPSIRMWYSLSVIENRIYLFGGFSDGKRLNDTYELTVIESADGGHNIELVWKKIVRITNLDAAPSPSTAHSSVALGNDKIVFFGGFDGTYRKNGVYVLQCSSSDDNDTIAYSWDSYKVCGKPPPARYSHTAVALDDTRVIVFGGHSSSVRNDAYVLTLCESTKAITWSKLELNNNSITPRYCHSAIMYGTLMVVFGGYSTDGFENDMHVLDCSSI